MSNAIALSLDEGLGKYINQIRKFPMLTADEEFMLAKRYQEHEDKEAAHKLVTSHLRLVVKLAYGYKNYGLPLTELVSEGNIGLMQAVKKFDADKGFRLSTYAIWWIRASMQEYILRSWSLVKIGTTAAQKKLFFNLRKAKNKILQASEAKITDANFEDIAVDLNVSVADVKMMDQRMTGADQSLNSFMNDEENGEWIDLLEDGRDNQEVLLGDSEELGERHDMLMLAMDKLTEREREILTERRLAEKPKTLEDLSQVYGVSRERIRQIESRAIEKLQGTMVAAG